MKTRRLGKLQLAMVEFFCATGKPFYHTIAQDPTTQKIARSVSRNAYGLLYPYYRYNERRMKRMIVGLEAYPSTIRIYGNAVELLEAAGVPEVA